VRNTLRSVALRTIPLREAGNACQPGSQWRRTAQHNAWGGTKSVPSGLPFASKEETKNWATLIAAQSRLKLTHFGQNPTAGSFRAETHVAFENDNSAYHVWIMPEFNLILLDVFHKSLETDRQLFRGELTLSSLERISRILNSPQSSNLMDGLSLN